MTLGRPIILKAIAIYDKDENEYGTIVLWNNNTNSLENSFIEIHMITDTKHTVMVKDNIKDTGDTYKLGRWGGSGSPQNIIFRTYNDIGIYQELNIPVNLPDKTIPIYSPKNVNLSFDYINIDGINGINITWDIPDNIININDINSKIFCYSISVFGINPDEKQTFYLNNDSNGIFVPYSTINYQIKTIIIHAINNNGRSGNPFAYNNPDISSLSLSIPKIEPKIETATPFPSTSPFRFIAVCDTKTGTDILTAESVIINSLNPHFWIYAGDLCESFDIGCVTGVWKTAINGGNTNNMFYKTFATRGNHDSSADSDWQSCFNFGPETVSGTNAANIGAVNYNELTKFIDYSFDFGNSRFIGLDCDGDVSNINSTQINWLNSRLTDATNKGLTHAFLFWHGPIYDNGDGHCSDNSACGSCDYQVSSPCIPQGIIDAINHPIVSATFHGHEHVLTYAHMTGNEISGLTHEFETFTSGTAGADLYGTLSTRRIDFYPGRIFSFCSIDVNGNDFTVKIYKESDGTVAWTKTFTKSSGGCSNPTCAFQII